MFILQNICSKYTATGVIWNIKSSSVSCAASRRSDRASFRWVLHMCVWQDDVVIRRVLFAPFTLYCTLNALYCSVRWSRECTQCYVYITIAIHWKFTYVLGCGPLCSLTFCSGTHGSTCGCKTFCLPSLWHAIYKQCLKKSTYRLEAQWRVGSLQALFVQNENKW